MPLAPVESVPLTYIESLVFTCVGALISIVVCCGAVAFGIYVSRAAIVGVLIDAAATLSTLSTNIAMIGTPIIFIFIFIFYNTSSLKGGFIYCQNRNRPVNLIFCTYNSGNSQNINVALPPRFLYSSKIVSENE